MPKFTMKDVDKQIDEIRERHHKKPTNGRGLVGRLMEEARRRRTPRPPGERTV